MKKKKYFKPEIIAYSDCVRFDSNNWLKLHGISMKRRVHMIRVRKMRWNRFIDKWNALGHPGPIFTADEIRRIVG